MDQKEFTAVVDSTVKATADLLKAKGNEYANSTDRLANFKRNAEKQRITPLAVWKIYYGKHADSIDTYFNRVQAKAEELAMSTVIGLSIQADVAGEEARLGMGELPQARKNVLRDIAASGGWPAMIQKNLPRAIAEVNAELSEPIQGRFHDIINYCFLCLALLEELEKNNA